jgi:nickel/cobalt transporter (NicO) family protein
LIRRSQKSARLKALTLFVLAAASVCGWTRGASAHPLGNFTINHYARLIVSPNRLAVHYVIDMAEIPALQEMQRIDVDGDGAASDIELQAYARRAARDYESTASLNVDGLPAAVRTTGATVTLPVGAGGLRTLRLEGELEAMLPSIRSGASVVSHRVRFEDHSYQERIGWRELVVVPEAGAAVFDSNIYGNGLSDGLKAYPEDSLSSPLNERSAEFTISDGVVPPDARPLVNRDGRKISQSRDRLAELISVPKLTPSIALFGLLLATGLGALHAMSPGHGKTVVGAYLAGSRGTARHAAFLGLTVTITHTIGVFALGIVTLAASQYVVPERLFPILSLISGALVVGIGLNLFVRRIKAAFPGTRRTDNGGEITHTHSHDDFHHKHDGDDAHSHSHQHHHSHEANHSHSHGGRAHTHLPPGSDGSPVTWRSLLALGISGGLLPCPSALVVLLSAIALHRVAYGLFLVLAFSAGLAATLTAVGLAFVYAGRLVARPIATSRLVRILPIFSALFIACVGAAICYEALQAVGVDRLIRLSGVFSGALHPNSNLSIATLLLIGFGFGIKHATEADHLAAVSTIVTERKGLLGSSIVGGLWGAGHTLSLLVAGTVILLFRVNISESVSRGLESCVALMLVVLGVNALRRVLRGEQVHIHWHANGDGSHAHVHFHEHESKETRHSHHTLTRGARPVIVGMVHGLAGSAALMLLVLSTINSRMIGLVYIIAFGLGSIGGMMIMSALISLPLLITGRFARLNRGVQTAAAIGSVGMGVYVACQLWFPGIV